MRTHFPSIPACAAAWAKQAQPEGNAGHRFYFRGPFVYSYRDGYPVGRIMPGKEVALIWSGHYSVSTSNHTKAARKAASTAGYRLFEVKQLGHADETPQGLENTHQCNAYVMSKDLQLLTALTQDSASNPRRNPKRSLLEIGGPACQRASDIEHYCRLFAIPVPGYVQQWSHIKELAEFDRALAARQLPSKRRA